MQRGRSAPDPFLEPFDLNQGSLPENTAMDHFPVESRLSNYMLGVGDGNVSCIIASDSSTQSFSGWDRGESSSNANNMHDKSRDDVPKTRAVWPSASDSCSTLDARSENPENLVNARPLAMQNLGSNDASMSLNLNSVPSLSCNPTLYASSSNVGTFAGRSSTSSSENYDSSGPSFGSWGSSCKRKALDGSSSSNQAMDRNAMQHPYHGSYSTSGNLNISSTNLVEQVNPSIGIGVNRAAPSLFPSSSVPRVADNSARHFATRSNYGRLEPVPSNTQVRNSSVFASQPSELRPSITLPINRNNPPNQPHLMPANEATGTHSYPWNGSLSSRGGSSSSSFMASRQRGSGAREEVNIRSSRRNNLEARDTVLDQIDWSFAPARNHPSSSRAGPSSRAYSGAWLPHQNQMPQNHQRLSESFPWIPLHRVEPESGTRRGQFSLLPSASSSSDGAASSSRHQLDQRSAAFLMDIEGDDVNGWRSLAAVESRHRLMRQVLNAMRRGVHLQAEDAMLIDPFISGLAELHDRHRDMRLDVDNMSYEELLAMEERIGNVSTGLSEQQILASMKQHQYEATRSSVEPCCICQEEYATGEDIGVLDCGHEFHSRCIKQWLALKNLCPICKMTALKAK